MKKMLLVIGLAVMLACTAGTAAASFTDGTSTADFAIVGGNHFEGNGLALFGHFSGFTFRLRNSMR